MRTTLRLFKVIWLPLAILLLIVVEPYFGISGTPYVWAYIGIQAILFIVYACILNRDRHSHAAPGNKGRGKRGP